MLNCKQASELISQSLDERLSWSSRISLNFHLLMCKYCKRFSKQMIAMKTAINGLRNTIEENESIQLSPGAKDRIMKKINPSDTPDSH